MTELPARYWLVMPAAGAGRRFGGPKQYAPLDGRTMIETALQLFVADKRCAGGAVVLAAEDPQRERLAARLPSRFRIVEGGIERAHSVRNGLAALAPEARQEDWVLVHDAARPCLSAADLTRLLEVGSRERVGALLAVPLADTLKRAAGETVAETLSREGLWQAQTPQMFRHAPLLAALQAAAEQGRSPTDEAQAMEWRGLSARLVPAADSNFKVTSAADLALAEAILAARKAQASAPALNGG